MSALRSQSPGSSTCPPMKSIWCRFLSAPPEESELKFPRLALFIYHTSVTICRECFLPVRAPRPHPAQCGNKAGPNLYPKRTPSSTVVGPILPGHRILGLLQALAKKTNPSVRPPPSENGPVLAVSGTRPAMFTNGLSTHLSLPRRPFLSRANPLSSAFRSLFYFSPPLPPVVQKIFLSKILGATTDQLPGYGGTRAACRGGAPCLSTAWVLVSYRPPPVFFCPLPPFSSTFKTM